MRLDKYLKVARKREVIVTNDDGESETYLIPFGSRLKVREGDVLEITFGARTLRVRVLDVRETVGKAGATSLYEVLD